MNAPKIIRFFICYSVLDLISFDSHFRMQIEIMMSTPFYFHLPRMSPCLEAHGRFKPDSVCHRFQF